MALKTEEDLIRAMQRDTAYAKRILARIASNAQKVASLNHKEGRFAASADAMEWHADVQAVSAALTAGHAKSSRSLVKHYGEKVMIAAGPWR